MAAVLAESNDLSGAEKVFAFFRDALLDGTLKAGERLIYPSAYPRTAERLRALGFEVDEVDIGELEKAEAGLTCMSLIAD